MSSKSLVVILMMGAFGALAFAMVAMFGVKKMSETPMVRARIEVAERHKISEVSFSFQSPDKASRTLRVGYETEVLAPSMEAQTAEMEAIAQFSLDRARFAEAMEDEKLKEKALEKREKPQLPVRPPVTRVLVNRTWRRDRGCLKRSDTATHEWTPPPQPPARK
jgi:hypothetical protein